MENNSLAALEMKKEAVERQIRNKWWWNFWTTIIFWIGIFVFLAFLGFNVFTALGETSDVAADIVNKVKNFFTPILHVFGINPNSSKSKDSTSKDTSDSSSQNSNKSEKSNGLINNVSNTKVSGIDSIQNSISNPNPKQDDNDKKLQNYQQNDSFNKRNITPVAPNTSQRKNQTEEGIIKKRFPISDILPEPSEANTFNTIATGHGYCFIGEDQGVRSCVQTDDVGSCPTGLGYQSQATCQNPNLRD
jgi:hypothetical protein